METEVIGEIPKLDYETINQVRAHMHLGIIRELGEPGRELVGMIEKMPEKILSGEIVLTTDGLVGQLQSRAIEQNDLSGESGLQSLRSQMQEKVSKGDKALGTLSEDPLAAGLIGLEILRTSRWNPTILDDKLRIKFAIAGVDLAAESVATDLKENESNLPQVKERFAPQSPEKLASMLRFRELMIDSDKERLEGLKKFRQYLVEK